MSGFKPSMKRPLCLALCMTAALSSACVAEDSVDTDRVQNVDWITTDVDAEVAEAAGVEQVQFSRFFNQAFGRPAIATTTPQSPAAARSQASRPRQLAASAPSTPRRQRLARTPDMLGDSFLPSLQLSTQPRNNMGNPNNELFVNSPLAVAGGSARSKFGEHNKPLPADRLYFNYNYFHNAVDRQAFAPGVGEVARQTASVNRFTLGAETTLFNGDASLGVILPLTNYPDINTNFPGLGPTGRFQSDTGAVGNVSLIGKKLLVNADDLVVSCGMAIELPTGANGSTVTGTTLFTVENESLFLQPFLAMTLDNGHAFIHSVLQVDVDVESNRLTASDMFQPGPSTVIGKLNQQTLIHFDTSAGIWLSKSDDTTGITGVAAIAEFHHTSAVSSADQLAGVIPTQGGAEDFILSPAMDNFSASYITTGIHTEVAKNKTIRVAAVFPLRSGVNKYFDAELQVQIGSRF